MKREDLLRRLSKAGFPLFETEESQDVNATLAELVKSNELRLWEVFPAVLTKNAEEGLFDYNAARQCLEKRLDKTNLELLVLMSLALYKVLNLKFSWTEKLYNSLSVDTKKKFSVFVKLLYKNDNFQLGNYTMSSGRLKTTFQNYFNQTQARLNDLFYFKEQLSLEYALSQVFSSKQKELFLKKLKGEKLNKTEKEYYSRTVKKKVLALANPELHRLSQKLLE